MIRPNGEKVPQQVPRTGFSDHRARRREYYRRNRLYFKAKHDQWRAANKERIREYRLREKYGIDYEEFKKIFTRQSRRCAICRTKTPPKRGWTVDHCHRTGRVRGVLCFNCNIGIGALKDKPSLCLKAAKYLECP
jgi:recombination endonuclease VII